MLNTLKPKYNSWVCDSKATPAVGLFRDWSLESVIEGLQKQFLNSLTHRQASNKFDTIEQGQKMVQELIQELTKYAA